MRILSIILLVGGLGVLYLVFTPTTAPSPGLSGTAVLQSTATAPTTAPVLSGTAVLQSTASPLPTNFLEMDAIALNAAGLDALKYGNWNLAMTYFQYAIERNPKSYEPYNNLASILYELGRDVEAIKLWQQALELEYGPNSPDTNAGLGTALAATQGFWVGWEYYCRALQLDGHYADATWMQQERSWGPRAIQDSALLRENASQCH